MEEAKLSIHKVSKVIELTKGDFFPGRVYISSLPLRNHVKYAKDHNPIANNFQVKHGGVTGRPWLTFLVAGSEKLFRQNNYS